MRLAPENPAAGVCSGFAGLRASGPSSAIIVNRATTGGASFELPVDGYYQLVPKGEFPGVMRERAVDPDGTPLGVGDVVLADQRVGGSDHYFRIKGIREGEDIGELELEVESELGQFPAPYVEEGDGTVPDYEVPPAVPLEAALVVELPEALGEVLGAEVAVLAQPVEGGITAVRVWYSGDDSSYVLIGSVPPVALYAELTAAAGSGASSLAVHVASARVDLLVDQEPQAQADDMLIGVFGGPSGVSEIVSLGSFTASGGGEYSVGVLRGRLGTLATSHASGTPVWIVRRADIVPLRHATMQYMTTRYFKLQPVNWAGQVLEFSDSYYDTVPGKHAVHFGWRTEPGTVTVGSTGTAFHVTIQPDGSTSSTPATITLSCAVHPSVPDPHYAWQRWTGSSWDYISGATASTLVLGPADHGRYRCFVTGGGGPINIPSAYLDIVTTSVEPGVRSWYGTGGNPYTDGGLTPLRIGEIVIDTGELGGAWIAIRTAAAPGSWLQV